MYSYLLLLVAYYPYFYFLFRIYQMYEQINFLNKIIYIIIGLFKSKKIDKDIDEIYDMITMTTPHNIEMTVEDDTGYVKYNEEDKTIKDDYFNQMTVLV